MRTCRHRGGARHQAVNARQYLARARRRLREERWQTPDEKLCRELVRRFEAAINGLDVPAMVMVLAEEQPMSVWSEFVQQGV
jgi:hypothetical protein